MSTDGTRPPTIAPRGATGARPDTARPRPANGSLTGTQAAPTRPGDTGASNGAAGGASSSSTSTATTPSGTSSSGTTPAGAPTTSGIPRGTGATSSALGRVGLGRTPSGAGGSGPRTGPSIADRLKRAATAAAETARNALPTREPGDVELDEDAREPRRTERPATSSSADRPAAAASGGPRKVRLAVARIDPWSVMKLAFLLSVAIGIMIVVAAAVVWITLDGLAVFTKLNQTIAEITGDPEFFDLLAVVSFDRVLSLATIVAVVDVVLLTALSTIGAFLYNIVAALVGGINLTLTDD